MSADPGPFSEWLRKHRNELGLALATLAVLIVTATLSDTYRRNPGVSARIVVREASLLGIFALGAATVIISGGIDLSSGSVIAFSGTVFSSVLVLLASTGESGTPVIEDPSAAVVLLALGTTLLAAFLVGSFHAWLITVIRLPPFVATLASLVGLRSLAKLVIQNVTAISHGNPKSTITIDSELLLSVGQERWWIPTVVLAGVAAVLWVMFGRTVVGRHLYAMGGNEEAARLSGIRTDGLKWLAYCIGSVTAAMAGVLYTCYVGAADPARDGLGYELNAIAAAVVGGCSLAGGIGSVPGVLLGALFLRVVVDSVAKLFRSRPDLFEGLVVGILVVLAVAFNELRAERGLRKQFFPGALGILNVLILTGLFGTIAYVTAAEGKLRYASIAAGVTFVLLVGRLVVERRPGSRP